MKLSTSEYLSGAAGLAMMAGSFALELVKTAAAGGSTSHAAASAKMAQQWKNAMQHFENGKSFKSEGK